MRPAQSDAPSERNSWRPCVAGSGRACSRRKACRNNMAYLAFAETTGGDVVETALHQMLRPPVGESRLSALEWSVVALAERDSLAPLRTPGRKAIAMGMQFGERPTPRLADEKLEALRRMAVLARHHGYDVPSCAIRDIVAAG